ncbi:MAG: GDSL-type esterase/lipase family protein [Chitinophagales bacterium]
MDIKKSLFIPVLFFSLQIVVAQTKQLAFVQYNENKITFTSDSSAMLAFYKKIDELKVGKINRITIAHYGGSHIQAGQWTEVMADSFQALQNFTGGGAFTFPFRIAHTNGPPFYRSFSTGTWSRCRCVPSELCAPLGMAGIVAVNNDSSASFGIQLKENGHINSFNSIKVFHNFNPDFNFEISPGFQVPYKKTNMPGFGYTLFQFEIPVDSVNFDLNRIGTSDPDFLLRGFSIENNNPGFYYASMGVNGASTRSYIHCEEFIKELHDLKPDLFIFSIGVNDAQDRDFNQGNFYSQYDSLVSMVRSVSPDCAILFTTISDNYIKRKTSNARSIAVNEAIFNLAEKNHAAVWDMFTIMGGIRSIDKWYRAGLASGDRIHFNSQGYQIIGNMMFEAIKNSYTNNSSSIK